LIQKTTCPHAFLECFKHTKGLLKHDEFSWKFCSCNFESIKKIFIYLFDEQCSHGDFSDFQKTISKDYPHTLGFFFLLSPTNKSNAPLDKHEMNSKCSMELVMGLK